MKNGRREADLYPRPSDIRSALEQFSRPMTGHTPQKLPLFRRNLLHHRSARIVSLHTLDYDTTIFPICQALFLELFTKNDLFFQ